MEPLKVVTGSDLHFRKLPSNGWEGGIAVHIVGGLPGGGAEEREMERQRNRDERREKLEKWQVGREWRASLRMIYDVVLNALSGQTGDTGRTGKRGEACNRVGNGKPARVEKRDKTTS